MEGFEGRKQEGMDRKKERKGGGQRVRFKGKKIIYYIEYSYCVLLLNINNNFRKMPLKCSINFCNYACRNHALYTNHLKTCHRLATSFTCNYNNQCTLKFKSLSSFLDHANSHSGQTSMRGQICISLCPLKCAQANCQFISKVLNYSLIDKLRTYSTYFLF